MNALKRATFAEGSQLESLGTSVFEGCASLESIALPAKLKTLAANQNSSTSANGVKVYYYKSDLFTNCSGLKTVDMSACTELTELEATMFWGCTAVETLLLPPNLETIGNYLFGNQVTNNGGRLNITYGMTSLKSITIPATVTSIGGYAFNGCVSLETVIFEAGSQLTELGTDEILEEAPDWGQDIFAGTTALQTVVLPENLELIGIGCFKDSGISKIDLPSSVEVISAQAFKNCDNLVDADLSPALRYLGDEAYYDCDALEKAD